MRDDLKATIAALRPGDELLVPLLAKLAPTVVAVLERIEQIHAKGAVVVETATGRRSDRDLASMLHDAMPKLRKGLVRRVAKKNGAKGGRPAKDRKMPRVDAERIWTSTRYPTDKEALQHMPGWNKSAAYRAFKASGRQMGRRPLKVVKRPRRQQK